MSSWHIVCRWSTLTPLDSCAKFPNYKYYVSVIAYHYLLYGEPFSLTCNKQRNMHQANEINLLHLNPLVTREKHFIRTIVKH